jgi:hypothetical protein
MTVKELCDDLNGYAENALVVMSKDTEGNAYSPLETLCPGKYIAETVYSGEIVDPKNKKGVKAVVLWPAN